ncbi:MULTISPECIES: hypothetical protein [unclassified Streptomyces]|nr:MULTISPECIES: hypothetical protein [unclassified Streptomyces]
MERPPLLPRTALALAAAAARASLNSHGLQTTYLLTRNFKAYKLQ